MTPKPFDEKIKMKRRKKKTKGKQKQTRVEAKESFLDGGEKKKRELFDGEMNECDLVGLGICICAMWATT